MKKMIWWMIFSIGMNAAIAGTSAPPVASWRAIKHIVIIVLENTSAEGALQQPYLKSLTKSGAHLNQSFAVRHPSLPNYIALIAGDTYGVKNDGNYSLNAKHIGDLLDEKGLTWKAYAENLPSNCFLGSTSGPYARRHVPFYSFSSVQNNPGQCKKVVAGELFFQDLKNHTLPAYSFYTPNVNNDGHDTGVAYADKWLKTTFGPIFRKREVMKDTLFIITFDEDDNTVQNRIYTVFIGAGVRAGAISNNRYTHYDVLRTVEDIFDLGTLNQNDKSGQSILDIW